MIEVQNISFDDRLNDVKFDWHQGEIVALMGANGSGKSTLARLITGLIEPTSGEILLTTDGISCAWNTATRWQEVGFVGQHPRRQTIGATVADELGYGLLNLGHDIAWVRNRVQELAASVGLSGKEDQSPSTLSGGERQRLVTASILAMQPSFLILDEALSMLDVHSQAMVLELLHKAKPDTGQLWITHDPELARLADRLFVLKNGILIDFGKPEEALMNKEMQSLYGGEAYVNLTSRVQRHRQTVALEMQIPRDTHSQPVLEWKEANYESRLSLDKVVRAGEFIGVVGRSGSGKTTLLDSAIGFILPTEGQYLVGGQQITKANLNMVRRKNRLVLQEAGEYLIGRSVYHEVFYGDSKRDLLTFKQARLTILEEFGIPAHKADYAPERLSGGERQKVALAASLTTLPQILLLDEPLLGLDALGRVGIQAMITQWNHLTILYVTHDLREILRYADRLWLVEKGEIVLDCPTQCWKEHQEQFQASGVRC